MPANDREGMDLRNATISLWADQNFAQATVALVGTHASHMRGSIAVMPSSMDAKDPFVGLVSAALPEQSHPFTAVPVSGAAARRAFVTPNVIGRWIDRTIQSSGTTLQSITCPQEIAQADHRVVVTDVVEVARMGPFVLDLPARYIHPRQRMKLLASGQREHLAAEVAGAYSLDLMAVYMSHREGVVLAVTTDPIAAELVALAMSELCLGSPRSFTGPWEDPVVQRATELEMGVVLPNRIHIIVDGPNRADHWAQRVASHVHLRLGVPQRH